MSEQAKRKVLTNEEKLEIMIEYQNVIGEKIKSNTEYRGYKIGGWKNNYRQAYFKGTLKMSEQLLRKFKDAGIISEQKERRDKSSTQEKYDFLMRMAGKSEREIQFARMQNGLDFATVRNAIQSKYNSGDIDLSEQQIKDLIKAGLLNYSKEEEKEASKKYGIPSRYVQDILRRYGSYEEFLDKYKKREIDYDFKNDIFTGYRAITLSEKDMTEAQKLIYCEFAMELAKPHIGGTLKYIDIDELEQVLADSLTEREQQIIKLRFGLEGKKHSLEECAKIIQVTAQRVREIELKAIKKLLPPQRIKSFFGDPQKDRESLARYEAEYGNLQGDINDYNTIKDFITDENGEIKNGIEDVKLSKIGISGRIFSDGIIGHKTIRDLVQSASQDKKTPSVEILKKPIEDLNFTLKTFNILKRNRVDTVAELIRLSKKDLSRMRNFGVKSINEVVKALEKMGLSCREDKTQESTSMQEESKALASILEMCDRNLAIYVPKRNKIKEQIDNLREILRRYDIAYENYLHRANIFDPNSIVLAVPKTIKKQEQSEKQSKSTEQRKKEMLLRSIRESQQQLAELKEILAKFGLDEARVEKD